MKNTLSLAILLLLCSCASVDPSILKPGNNAMPKKMNWLKIGLGEKTIVRAESEKSVKKQSEIFTILERELETNVFDKSKENWGYLEYKIVFNATNPTARGKKLFLIQNLTFWSFYIFGFPITEIERTIEVEINIFAKGAVLHKNTDFCENDCKSVPFADFLINTVVSLVFLR